MPLFGNKFSPRKTPIRKSNVNVNSDKLLEDLIGENRAVKISLGDQALVFENGEWVPCKTIIIIFLIEVLTRFPRVI